MLILTKKKQSQNFGAVRVAKHREIQTGKRNFVLNPLFQAIKLMIDPTSTFTSPILPPVPRPGLCDNTAEDGAIIPITNGNKLNNEYFSEYELIKPPSHG